MDEHKNPIPFWWLLVLLIFAALLAASLALRYGSARLDLAALLHGLLRTDPTAPEAKILWIVRLPHVTVRELVAFDGTPGECLAADIPQTCFQIRITGNPAEGFAAMPLNK